jgi:ribonuclease P protein component
MGSSSGCRRKTAASCSSVAAPRVGSAWLSEGAAVPAPRSLRPHERIRRRPEFKQVHDRGIRIPGRLMTALLLANGLTHDRLGIIASRRIGGAVQRNKAKRLIREVFRLNKRTTGTGSDIVIIPRVELVEAQFSSIEADYRSILQRHGKRSRS